MEINNLNELSDKKLVQFHHTLQLKHKDNPTAQKAIQLIQSEMTKRGFKKINSYNPLKTPSDMKVIWFVNYGVNWSHLTETKMFKKESEAKEFVKTLPKNGDGTSKVWKIVRSPDEGTDSVIAKSNTKENTIDFSQKKIAILKSNAPAKVKLNAVKILDNSIKNNSKKEELKNKVINSNASDAVKNAALKILG